jgi:hypothetical protein
MRSMKTRESCKSQISAAASVIHFSLSLLSPMAGEEGIKKAWKLFSSPKAEINKLFVFLLPRWCCPSCSVVVIFCLVPDDDKSIFNNLI